MLVKYYVTHNTLLISEKLIFMIQVKCNKVLLFYHAILNFIYERK